MSALTDDEREALRYASAPALTPAERRELLHFLGYPDALPLGTQTRIEAVAEQILTAREAAIRDQIKADLPALLAGHIYKGASSIWCSCGTVVQRDERRPNVAALHREHLADVIAARIAGGDA